MSFVSCNRNKPGGGKVGKSRWWMIKQNLSTLLATIYLLCPLHGSCSYYNLNIMSVDIENSVFAFLANTGTCTQILSALLHN